MAAEILIGDTRIGDDTPAYVVAEIGANHQGSIDICKRMFDAAAAAGVNAVKLQRRTNTTLYTPEALRARYDSPHAFGDTYGEHREALEFDFGQYCDLKAHARGLGLHFFATAWDISAAAFLEDVGVPAFKVASGDLYTPQLVAACASYGKPVIISTGGGLWNDVANAVSRLEPHVPLAVLQCTASYPCPPSDMHLAVITTYRMRMGERVVVGLSDHYDGIELAAPAYALGARIFEKHFTLDRTMKGSDQAFSLEPPQMRAMVDALRITHEAMGDGIKRRLASEQGPLEKMWKSVRGDQFTSPFDPTLPRPSEVW